MSDRLEVGGERGGLPPKRYRPVWIAAVACVVGVGGVGCGGRTAEPPAAGAPDTAASRAVLDTLPAGDAARVGPYVVRVLGSESEPQRVAVLRDGRTVYESDPGWRMRIGRLSGPEAGGVEPGTDVNADGIPDVTVWDWSGGAHCCFTTIVLSLGPRVDSLVTIATGNTGGRFVNLDDDPALEFETAEDGFAYWPASYAESPSPRVVLDWTGGSLVASPTLTFRPVSRDSALALADRLRRELDWRESAARPSNAAQLFQPVADLYFAGEPDLAREFFARARPDTERQYLDRLLVEFGQILGRSAYWQALERGLTERD